MRAETREIKNKVSVGNGVAKFFSYAVLTIGAIFVIVPFLYGFLVSVKSSSDAMSTTILPREWHFENYAYVLQNTTMPRAFLNTMIYILPPMIVGVLTSAMAAYAFARLYFPGKNVIFSVMFSTIVIPGIMLLVPSYIVFSKFYGWAGTALPIMVPGMFGSVMVMFYLRQFIRTIPKQLEEAALLDGMNKGRIFMSIIIPLIRPALIAQFILSFNGAFNDLVGPLMYLGTNQNLYTVQLVINSLNTAYGAQIELLLSASFLALVPTFILFAVAQNYFVEGIAMSGLKG